MRVGLNAICFNDRPSGANQRFAGIYGALIARCPEIEFVIFEPVDCRVADWFGGAPNVTVRRTPLPSTGRVRRAIGGLLYWRRALKREKLDLFEMFHLPLLRAPDCPTVMTVHDARPVLRNVPLMKRLFYGRILKSGLRRADHVITVSETMQEEIVGIEPRASVSAIYNGIDPSRFQDVNRDEAEGTRMKLGLPARFILAVGHLEARKNYLRLLAALAQLRADGEPIALAIVGNEGGEGATVAAEVRRLNLDEHVRLLQGVSDQELSHIYALSELVAFPSTYEGFGIPILEAMAARRPLVLSDIPVFRELTEDKGAYFPPDDAVAMAATIRDVLASPDRQQALVAYGERRIADFTFPALARQVEQVYKSKA
ncbi:glycosyltransferase family 1 protein [Sphingosinicella sp. BN140058]|uniref:glycosyltransferase family 4 protein n=1 Tax=Sphingosinicella sp. BN140058 TaxID=1892855 RepID=UPI0010106D34|nr:glycosyltransferase family 1 protein [Sphingosinicella sp. BN140058]QAY77035.1 glycosyltransferase family 1 protein [Sphingosinicella sp. BN140058]